MLPMSIVASLTLSSPAHAVPWSSGPDLDTDGIVDTRDRCLGLPETVNAFADTDGCPDYRMPVQLQASFQDSDIAAEAYVVASSEERIVTSRPPRAMVRPGERITVAAKRECLEGQKAVEISRGATVVLELDAVWDHTMVIDVRHEDGRPATDARLSTVASSTDGCAPAAAELSAGGGTWSVGEGVHLLRIEAPGSAPVDRVVVVGEEGPAGIRVVLPDASAEGAAARVHFPTDAATLDDASRAVLKQLALDVRNGVREDLRITGHADPRGSDRHNRQLSLRRARAVRDFLVAQGVDDDAIHLVAEGETEPLVEGATARAHAANRRATVRVVAD